MRTAVKKSPGEIARRYEVDALKSSSYASRISPLKTNKSEEYRTDAARNYILAGDKWLEEFSMTGVNKRQKNNALDYAIADYRNALKLEKDHKTINEINKKLTDANKIKRELEKKSEKSPLERLLADKLYLFILSFVFFFFSLFFSLFSWTGNAVAILTSEDFRWVGLCFFICGLIFTFVYFKKFKKNEK